MCLNGVPYLEMLKEDLIPRFISTCNHTPEYDNQIGEFVCSTCALLLGEQLIQEYEERKRYLAGNKPYNEVLYFWKIISCLLGDKNIPLNVLERFKTYKFSGNWYDLYKWTQDNNCSHYFLASPAIFGYPLHYEHWMLQDFLSANRASTRKKNLNICYVLRQIMTRRGKCSSWVPLKLRPESILGLDVEWWGVCELLDWSYTPVHINKNLTPKLSKTFHPVIIREPDGSWGLGYPTIK